MSIHLSKSQFIRGLQCQKSLWLLKNRPELQAQMDVATQTKHEQGSMVGILAQQLFPGGDTVEYDPQNFPGMLSFTQQLLKNGATTIYEAAFSFDDIFIKVDILHKGKNGWEIHEVKSSTEVKDIHLNDVAIQHYVLTGNGINVSQTTVIHINNEYVRHGELDIRKAFKIVDVSDQVLARRGQIQSELSSLRKAVGQGMPERDIGLYCNEPYPCDFQGVCWEHVPDYSIFNLNRLNKKKKFDLYYQGVLRFDEIPAGYPLTDAQMVQVQGDLSGKTLIDNESIRLFLDELWFPLYFLDFETFQQPIPLFEGLSPYQQIPFQYSLHYLETEGGGLQHKEYLAREGSDPRKELAERLVADIPETACVLVYNQAFEKGVIQNLAKYFPDLRNGLLAIHDNIRDLMRPFQQKDYYVPQMKGRYSIKCVLPALVSDLSYAGLEISNGGEAMGAYGSLHLVENMEEREKIRRALLEYCKLDTLAMVRIYEKLKNL